MSINQPISEFELIIRELFAAYPISNADELTVAVYAKDLSTFPLEILGPALQRLRRKRASNILPSVGECYLGVEEYLEERRKEHFRQVETQERLLREAEGIPAPPEIRNQIRSIFAKMGMDGYSSVPDDSPLRRPREESSYIEEEEYDEAL
jgi:hypothetical protein